MTKQHEIAARLEGEDCGFTRAPMVHDGAHLEIVARDHASEAESATEQTEDDGRKRGRKVRIKRGIANVGGHQHRYLRCDGGTERQQLDRVQRAALAVDDRQLEMRVGGRVAVTRKVLAASEKT